MRRKEQGIHVTRSVIFGKRRLVEAQAAWLKRSEWSEGQINTAHTDRDNLTLRQKFYRLDRKTLGFSRKRQELQNALDLIDAHDNVVKPYRALRLRAPSQGNPVWIRLTPAMAAGMSNRVWTLQELLCIKA